MTEGNNASLAMDGFVERNLATYEELFANRYTDLDPDYVLTTSKTLPDPPCVENWYSRPRRDGGNRGRGGYRGGYRGGRQDYQDRNYHQQRQHGYQDRSYGQQRQHGGHYNDYRSRDRSPNRNRPQSGDRHNQWT